MYKYWYIDVLIVVLLYKILYNIYVDSKLNNKKGNKMKFSKKEINALHTLLHNQVISIDPEEINEEIEDSGSIFGLKSIAEAKVLEQKLLKSLKQ